VTPGDQEVIRDRNVTVRNAEDKDAVVTKVFIPTGKSDTGLKSSSGAPGILGSMY
jgi:hypothetical protein